MKSWEVDGGVPMSYVDYKKWKCQPVVFKKTSCRPVKFKKTSCRMSLKPKKGPHPQKYKNNILYKGAILWNLLTVPICNIYSYEALTEHLKLITKMSREFKYALVKN